MIQPYSLGTNVTRIDGSNIATGTINANDAVIDGTLTAGKIATNAVTADKITAGCITTNKLVLGSYDNLCPNPSSTTTGGMTAGSFEAKNLVVFPGGYCKFAPNQYCRGIWTPISGNEYDYVGEVACKPGDVFYAECDVVRSYNQSGSVWLGMSFYDYAGNASHFYSVQSGFGFDGSNPGKAFLTATCPATAGGGQAPIRVKLFIQQSAVTVADQYCYFNNFYWRRCADANLIVDGTITATKMATSYLTSTSAVSGGTQYSTFNAGNTPKSNGFKLSHAPFGVNLADGTTNYQVQAEFGAPVSVAGYPLGPSLAIPLSALEFPSLTSLSDLSRVFYRGNSVNVPNIDCFDIRDWGYFEDAGGFDIIRFQWRLQPSDLSDNLDCMRMARVKLYFWAGGVVQDTFYIPLCDRLYDSADALSITASCATNVMTVTAVPTPDATVTATYSTTTMTVTATTGTLKVGHYIVGSFVTPQTRIIGFGTGAGGTGTYYLSNSVSGTGTTYATMKPIVVGMPVKGTGIAAGTKIASLGTGFGNTGTYNLSTTPGTLASQSVKLSTDAYMANASWGDFTWARRTAGSGGSLYYNDGATYPFLGHLGIAISNAYGWSQEKYFHSSSATPTVGTFYTRDSTAPAGAPPSGGGGGGGYTGGGGCVPQGTPLLTKDGPLPVEQVLPGQWVVAYDEHTLDQVEAQVVHLFEYKDRGMYLVTTSARTLTCSHDHRIGCLSEDSLEPLFPPARELVPGMQAYNSDLGLEEILAVEPLGYRDTVYHVQLDKGHVFVVGGLTAHNMQMKILAT